MLGHYTFCDSTPPATLILILMESNIQDYFTVPTFFNTSFSLIYSGDVDHLLDFMEEINSIFWGFLQDTKYNHH